MEIVKVFNENNLHTEIVIKGTSENPLFRASDVGNVLEITNIRTTINDFNTTEKVVHTMHTLGGKQQVTFLTEKGLYNGVKDRYDDNCVSILKDKFETIHGAPILYKNGIGQYNEQNNLVKEFSCKYDCIRELKMSDKTLAKALDKNIQYNGYFYKSM